MSQEQTVIVAAIGAISTIIAALIAKSKYSKSSPKTFDDGVMQTNIKHLEEHYERLEKTVSGLDKGVTAHNIEIDGIKNVLDELKKVIKELKQS